MNIRFTVKAAEEFRAASAWYEEQRKGLGSQFIVAVDAALQSVRRTPMLFPIAFDEIHRCTLKRFPFGVFYSVEDESIVIVGVYHSRREPLKLRGRR